MNATEDGSEASEAPPPRPGLAAGFQWLALAGLLIGPLLGVVAGPRLVPDRPLFEARVPWEGAVPAPEHWSHSPAPGESAALVTTGAKPVLATRARTPAAAEALAIELTMTRLSRAPELSARRDAGRARWSESVLQGPAATLSPAASCAALLRGWSMAWRAVVTPAESPAPGGAASAAGAIPPLPDLARLALAPDPAGLADALHREARVARGMLFARIGPLPDARRAAAAESWRGAWSARAADLDTIAAALEARLPRIERQLVATVAPAYALGAEPTIPDPGVIALLSASLPPVAARPLWATWGVFAGAGAILACLIAVPLGWSAARARAARRAALVRQIEKETAAALAATPWTPSASVEARLQVVTGPRPRRVASVVRELVAHFLTSGERVLVVDAGRSFRLHDSFGGRARLGFQECMRERLPLLGVVQRGGLPGLFVLAHGSAARLESWMPLRRILEQARPHFSRVVLALEPNVPRQAGEALAGRLIDGWWAAPDARKARGARGFSTRLGIPLRSYELDSPADATIETLVERMSASRAPQPPATQVIAQAVVAVAPEPVPAAAVALAAAETTPEPAPVAALTEADATPEPYAEPAPPAATALEPEAEPVMAWEQEVRTLAILDEDAAMAGPPETEVPAPSEVAMDHVPEVVTPPTLEATLAMISASADEIMPEPPALDPAPALEEVPVAAFTPEPPGLAPAAAFEEVPVEAESLEPPRIAQELAPGEIAAPVSGPDPVPASPAASVAADEVVVLDCDPEVSERLRFLVWMRRLRAKKKDTVHAP